MYPRELSPVPYSTEARRILSAAEQIALMRNEWSVSAVHLIIALDGIHPAYTKIPGVDLTPFLATSSASYIGERIHGPLPFTPEVLEILNLAAIDAQKWSPRIIRAGNLVRGILEQPTNQVTKLYRDHFQLNIKNLITKSKAYEVSSGIHKQSVSDVQIRDILENLDF